MNRLDRRTVLGASVGAFVPAGLATLLGGCQESGTESPANTDAGLAPGNQNLDNTEPSNTEPSNTEPSTTGASMKIHYLEMVTTAADELCHQYATVHGVVFGDPDPNLGGARTAQLEGGTTLAIRPPLRETELPVIRPYVLVEDIHASVKAAANAGAEVALPPMELPGHGTCAIVLRGGIECGFWQP